MKGEYEIKEPFFTRYGQVANGLLVKFDYELVRILKEENDWVNALTKVISAKVITNN